MKILYITTIGGTMGFFKSLIRELIDGGHTVDIATNETIAAVPDCYREWGCRVFQISCSRSPLDRGNLKAVKEIRRLAAGGGYEIVHCHTPIAAACTRVACRKLRKNGLKVIYTAHGFHFYTGAPLKNWVIYYPIEKLCAHWTDVLITINREDYKRAGKKLRAKRVEYVPGVGIDVRKFADATVDRQAKRAEIGVPDDAFMLLSVGELNKNKNHQIVIKALAEMSDPKLHYVIAGVGDKADELRKLAEEKNVSLHLLGHRDDVTELYKAADLYVLPSVREGLNVSVMEAMAAGLPVVCSRIRGNVDMIDENGGYLCDCRNSPDFSDAVLALLQNRIAAHAMGVYNRQKAEMFHFCAINSQMKKIYFGE